MFNMTVSWWELLVRSAVVYAALIFFLRVTGKRESASLLRSISFFFWCCRMPSRIQ